MDLLICLSRKTWVNYSSLRGYSYPSHILIIIPALLSLSHQKKNTKTKTKTHVYVKIAWFWIFSFCFDSVVQKMKFLRLKLSKRSRNFFFPFNPKENLRPWKMHSRLGWICLDHFLNPNHLWKVPRWGGREAPPLFPAPTAIWALTAIIVSWSSVTLLGLLPL